MTKREVAIVNLVVRGLTNKLIGKSLGISEGTVKMHLHKIYFKLKLTNRTQLALWATAEMMDD